MDPNFGSISEVPPFPFLDTETSVQDTFVVNSEENMGPTDCHYCRLPSGGKSTSRGPSSKEITDHPPNSVVAKVLTHPP